MARTAESSMPMDAKIKATKLRYIASQGDARERIGGALGATCYLDADAYLSVFGRFRRNKNAIELTASNHEDSLVILEIARDFLESLNGEFVLVELPNYPEFGAAQTSSRVIASKFSGILKLADDDIRILGRDLSCNLEISADRSFHDTWRDLNLSVSGSRWQQLLNKNKDVCRFTRNMEAGALT